MVDEKRSSDNQCDKSFRNEVIYISLVFLVAFGIYLIPILQNPMPFGDVDSSTHFGLGDNVGQNKDFSLNVPYYLNFTYGFANDGKMWYHPLLPYVIGISQMVSGSRVVAPFVLFALLSCLFIPLTVLLIKRLFGFWPSLLAVPLLLLSNRDFITYSLGLWPERASYSFIPLAALLYYYYIEKNSWKTAIPLGILLGVQAAFHIQGFMISAFILSTYTVYRWIATKKFPVDYKLLIAALITLVIFLPGISGLIGYNSAMNNPDSFKIQELGTLISWYPSDVPYTPQFADTVLMYGVPAVVLLILVFIFLLFGLVIKPKETTLVALWLGALYFFMHLNVLGFSSRISRFISAEGAMMMCVVALAIYFVIYGLCKFNNSEKFVGVLVSSVSVIFVVLFFLSTFPIVQNTYPESTRINEYQLDACEWIKDNTAKDIHVRIIGTPIYYERKWIQVLCQRHMIYDDMSIDGRDSEYLNMTTHIFFDKTMSLYNNRAMKINETYLKKLYENEYVEVYEYEKDTIG